MSEEGITCRYIFTSKEHKRAMRCYWRFSPLKWWAAGLFLFMMAVAIYPVLFPGNPDPSQATDNSESQSLLMSLFLNVLPMILTIGFIIFLIAFSERRIFRKGAFFNQEMIYTFRPSGVYLESPLVKSEIKWETFPKVTENQNGFALFVLGKRSFNWLPKSGFPSPESIDQCRNLFRQHVKDSSRLLPS